MTHRIRPAVPADRERLLALVPRLTEFGPPAWRAVEQMDRAETEAVAAAMDGLPADAALLVAEDGDGTVLGFVYLTSAVDYFTRETHGHVSIIVVAAEGEGRGVGRALLEAAEEWARGRGYRLLTLFVFDGNRRARGVYERMGYRPDVVKMVREL